MNNKTLSIIIKAQDQASKVLDRINSKAGRVGKSMSQYFGAATAASQKFALGLVAAGTAAAGLIGYGVKIAGDLESARQGFITLLGSAGKADKTISLIKKDAAKTPFELPGLIQANQMLTSITKDGNKSETILMNVGKALSAMGKGQPEMDRLIVNLQQIGAVGHASMLDIKQFAFAGIPIFDMLAKATGKTGESLNDMISNGEVTFDMLIDMFNKAGSAGGQFANAFTNQAGTFNQLVSNMKDSFGIFMSDIVKSTGMFDLVKGAIASLINFMNNNKDALVAGIKTFFDFVKANGPIVIGIIGGGLALAIGRLVLAVGGLLVTLAPFMAIGAAIAVTLNLLANRVGGWSNMLNIARTAVANVWSVVQGLFGPSLAALGRTITGQLVPALQKFWTQVSPILGPALRVLAIVVGSLLVGAIWTAINVLNVVIQTFSNLINRISMVIGWIRNLWNAFAGIRGAAIHGVSGINDILSAPFKAALSIIEGIASKISGIVGSVTKKVNSVRNAASNAVSSVTSHIPGFATGVRNFSGGLAVVGERGPELVNLPKGSDVYTNRESKAMAGSMTFNMYGNVNLGSAGAVDRFFERLNAQKEMGSLGVGV